MEYSDAHIFYNIGQIFPLPVWYLDIINAFTFYTLSAGLNTFLRLKWGNHPSYLELCYDLSPFA